MRSVVLRALQEAGLTIVLDDADLDAVVPGRHRDRLYELGPGQHRRDLRARVRDPPRRVRGAPEGGDRDAGEGGRSARAPTPWRSLNAWSVSSCTPSRTPGRMPPR